MAAFKYKLTQTPTQILDGTKAAYIQEIRGSNTRFTSTVTSPDTSTTPYCTILENDISISNGFPVWAWSPTAEPIEITVLVSEI
jgi:hypothetical protein